MKKMLLTWVLVVLSAVSAMAEFKIPPLQGRVNDLADMLNSNEERELSDLLESFEKSDSTQLVILTVPSLEGLPVEEASLKVAENWKIGQKQKDNGVLLFIAKQEKKIRIEVGYGLEGRLTDLLAGRVIDKTISPHFKNGRFYDGIKGGVNGIIEATRGEFKADGKDAKGEQETKIELLLILYGVVLVAAGLFGFAHELIGGIVGALGGPAATMFVFSPGIVALIIIAIAGFLIGCIARYIVEIGAHVAFSGGGGGGGFGGGGGGFGGGGASGGW